MNHSTSYCSTIYHVRILWHIISQLNNSFNIWSIISYHHIIHKHVVITQFQACITSYNTILKSYNTISTTLIIAINPIPFISQLPFSYNSNLYRANFILHFSLFWNLIYILGFAKIIIFFTSFLSFFPLLGRS